jgi:predicted PurR-regulated permease PerM
MVRFIADYLESGKIELPSLKPMLADVPFIGPTLQEMIVTKDVESILQKLSPVFKTVGQQLLSVSASLGSMLLQSLVAIIIAALFLHQADTAIKWSDNLSKKIADEKGLALSKLAVSTVSNVAQGILGVAIIQAILSGIGMMLASVPGTGFWTMVVLIVATIQLPPMLVLLPIAIYLFYTSALLTAMGFLVLAIVISIIDTPMRAFLMGRDSKTPILIIMMGAIGGMLAFGIIGLFVGAVVLSVGYELLKSWLNEDGVRGA